MVSGSQDVGDTTMIWKIPLLLVSFTVGLILYGVSQ